MPGKFKVKSKINLDTCEVGQELPESDFCTLTPEGNFVQLEYFEDKNEIIKFTLKPGMYSITATLLGMSVEKTVLSKDRLLDEFIHTKDVTDKIDSFFSRLHIYKEYGIEVPKRTMLFYGPPGSGKTSLINKACDKYTLDGKTAIIVWRTDKHDPYEVKQLFKSFSYEGVDKLILVAEDLGGVEVDQVRIKSESSLLALLDNQEKTFTIPTLILVTTNFPENFLGNLMNRPQRIDDKIEVGFPNGDSRKQLFKFFAKPDMDIPEIVFELLASKKCEEFTPAHIKEVFIRSAIYDFSLEKSVRLIIEDIEKYKNAYTKKSKLGLSGTYDSE